ncbi:MAG: T9SS type A sorting domain-containing protein [Bacteroidetes bacterium]|nr:T9SS type A sorting domain-containing protein [Bacteroidota bacterium]
MDGLIPKMVDIDDDGDLDLFITEYLGTSQFFENIGTPESPAFANPIANPFGIQTTYAYFSFFDFADMDGDGDQDLLQTASTGDPIILVYQENLGTPTQPNFGEPVSNPFSITNLGIIAAPNLVDFDNDGDIDLFFGKQNYDYTHEILYYENTSIINATNDLLKESTLTFGPNPTSDFISLQSEVITKNESINLSLINVSGQIFEQHTIQALGNQLHWKANIGHLPSGHYMIRLESDGHFGVIPFEKI